MLWSLGQVYLYKEFMTYLLSIISHPPTLTFHKPNLSVIPLSARHFLHICSGQHANVLTFKYFKKKKSTPTSLCKTLLKVKIKNKGLCPPLLSFPLLCAIPSFTQCVIHFQHEHCSFCNFFLPGITRSDRNKTTNIKHLPISKIIKLTLPKN